jgi:hypothetical protein
MCSGMQSTTSCGSNNSAIQSTASQSAVPADPTRFDRKREHWKHPMWWHMLSRPEQLAKIAAADKAVDLLWFVHGLSFNLIGSRLFCDAVEKIKAAPGYKPCHRTTLSTSHLAARNAEANEFKIKRLQHGKQYGFLVTSDGWRNKKRRSYHNFILVAANGPIFLSLKDVTGQAGTAKAITDEFSEVFETLDESVYDRIVIGCTDTPSANVSAWKSLEAAHPKQIWIGCMAHELSLLFKDWVQKVPAVNDLYRRLKNITIWIRNHGDILTQFEEKLRAQFSDKRKWTIKPYMPGDTRMGTIYKLADRALELKDILLALVTDPRYKASAQAAIQGYNGSTKAENRIPKGANGMYVDKIADDILSMDLWALSTSFVDTAKTCLYFHRLVDSNLPTMGKVYYTSALINKQLKVLSSSSALAKEMYPFYEKRWVRWHKDVHVLAYAMDPSYQSHSLAPNEKAAIKRVLKRLRPDTYAKVLIELNSFKADVDRFDQCEWDAVDCHHAYLWWDTMGDTLPELQSVAVDVLSKQCSASSCEFNWSAVSSVERKGRLGLHCETTNKSVNVAAMYHLERQTLGSGVHMGLPKLDEVVGVIVEEAEDAAPLGHTIIPENVVNSEPATNVERTTEEEEEEELSATNRKQLAEAQKLLYADWSTRDTLLDD